MNHILIFVPTTVLLSSVVIYFFLKKEADSYIEKVRDRKNRKAHMISLNLIRDIVLFFGTSRTSRETDRVLQSLSGNGKLDEDEIYQISISAIPEISVLYTRIEEMRRMDHESGILETLLRILVIFILLYGVIVSLIQYTVLFTDYFIPGSINIGEISQLVIGATIIFSVSALFICLDVFRRADIMANSPSDYTDSPFKEAVASPDQN